MREVAIAVCVTACSVADKDPSGIDGGTDAMSPGGGPPETTITAAPPAFASSGTATFEFTANHTNVSFACRIDGEAPVACTSPSARVLPDGGHAFSVRAIDADGAGDDTPAEHLWTIDTVAPDTMLTAVPPPADNNPMVRFAFRSNEEDATFDCTLDGGAYVACESGAGLGPIGDGSHVFAVRAYDRAGNLDASPAIHAWVVDTSAPDTQIVSGPDGVVVSTSATFSFVSPDAGGGATFACALDEVAPVPCASPYTIANLALGSHTFQVRARDAAGNSDPTPAMRTWTALPGLP